MKQHKLTPEILRAVWPRNFQPPTKLAGMNVEETAIWLEMVATFKGWTEGKAYALSFKRNGVTGRHLPCLTIEALRYELDILKLGHRLEITAAISSCELTLLNPFIVSIRPIDFHTCAGKPVTTSDSNIQWKKKWEKLKTHLAEVSKWLSNNCYMSSTCGGGHLKNNLAMQFHTDGVNDSNLCLLQTVEETGGWVSKNNSSFKRNEVNDMESSKVIRSQRDSKYPWLPPLELPPAVSQIDGRVEEDAGVNIGGSSIEQMMFELNLVKQIGTGIITCRGQAQRDTCSSKPVNMCDGRRESDW